MKHLFCECISCPVLTELRCLYNVLDNGQEVLSLQGGQSQLPRETERGKTTNNYSLFSEEEPHVQYQSGSLEQNWEWALNSTFYSASVNCKALF